MRYFNDCEVGVADFLSLSSPGLDPEVSLRFAQNALFLLLSVLNLCKYACKRRALCSIKKSDVLCFQVVLWFVPTIFHFLYFPGSPAALGPRRIPRPLPQPSFRARQIVHRLSTLIGYHRFLVCQAKNAERRVYLAGWRPNATSETVPLAKNAESLKGTICRARREVRDEDPATCRQRHRRGQQRQSEGSRDLGAH